MSQTESQNEDETEIQRRIRESMVLNDVDTYTKWIVSKNVTIVPNVMDDDLLKKGLKSSDASSGTGKMLQVVANADLDFQSAAILQLEYQNILHMDNLWRLESMTKLQLDNNMIETIEGLESLIYLKCLDLSFNSIDVIEGIECLINLEDLSLYHNSIVKIENMETLVKLKYFSIGHNSIDDFENIMYLSKLTSLKCLVIHNNPALDETEDVQAKLISYLPQLEYLDHHKIEEAEKTAAVEKYGNYEEATEEKQKPKLESFEVESVVSSEKFDFIEMFEKHQQWNDVSLTNVNYKKLQQPIPELTAITESFQAELNSLCKNVVEYVLDEAEKWIEEIEHFRYCWKHEAKMSIAKGKEHMDGFNEKKEKMVNILLGETNEDEIIIGLTNREEFRQILEQGEQDINDLWTQLIKEETELLDRLDDIINLFDKDLCLWVSTFTEKAKNLIREVKICIGIYVEQLSHKALAILKNRDSTETYIADFKKEFDSHEEVVELIKSMQNELINEITKREKILADLVLTWQKVLQDEFTTTLFNENRERVTDNMCYLDLQRNELEELAERKASEFLL